MAVALRFEDNLGLVHLQARQGYRWARSANSGLDYDDIFQVASLAFCIAAEGFRPEQGYKFSSYFTMVAFSEFRKAIGRMTGVRNLNPQQRAAIAARQQENRRRRAQAQAELPDMVYGLAPVSFSDLATEREEGGAAIPYESMLAGDGMSPQEIVERRQSWQQAAARLTPLASLIVDWLRDPPDLLLRELAAQRAHADRRNALGRRAYGLRDGVTIAAIGKLLVLAGRVSKAELRRAEAELEQVAEQMEGTAQ